MDNKELHNEAIRDKAQRIRKAKELIATAETEYAVGIEKLERRAVELTDWREQSIAYHQQVFDAAIADVQRQFDAGMAARFPGEMAQLDAERRELLLEAEEDIEQAEAEYRAVLQRIAMSKASEPLAAIRMSRARWRVLHDAGLKRAASLELWSGSDYSVKLYKKLRRALKLEEGAVLPPEVEAALQPTQADLDEAMVWATTPDDTGYRQIDDTKVNAQVGVPYIPDPATMPAVDPEVLAKLDEMLGH